MRSNHPLRFAFISQCTTILLLINICVISHEVNIKDWGRAKSKPGIIRSLVSLPYPKETPPPP